MFFFAQPSVERRLGRWHQRLASALLVALGLGSTLLLGACGLGTDAATRLAYDLAAAAQQLPAQSGATFQLPHRVPSRRGECEGPYRVQLDRVGALIVWCRDATGKTISSHSTSFHARSVDTPNTLILDKPAGETLVVELQRAGNGRALIVNAH